MKCRVKDGAELPHGGRVLTGGAEVDLPPAIAYEVRHLVDEITATGDTRPLGAADAAARELEQQLATALPHERITFLEAARERTAGDLKKIDDQIAAERKRLDAEKRAAEKIAKPADAQAPAKAKE